MTDLHTHILPGIDDGAQDAETSLRLLQMEKENRVDRVAFTPHFNSERQSVEEFCRGRDEAYRQLLQSGDLGVQVKLGAEIYFSPELIQLNLEKLCLQDTNILLIELPVAYNPQWTRDIFYELQMQGYRVLVAHVERYPYIHLHPEMLYDLLNAGIYTQMNASSLLHHQKGQKLIRNLLKWNLIQVIATDTHSVHRRPPRMAEALDQAQKWQDDEFVQCLIRNADRIFEGEEPEMPDDPHCPRHLFGDIYV